jgi:hypothetical protein
MEMYPSFHSSISFFYETVEWISKNFGMGEYSAICREKVNLVAYQLAIFPVLDGTQIDVYNISQKNGFWYEKEMRDTKRVPNRVKIYNFYDSFFDILNI